MGSKDEILQELTELSGYLLGWRTSIHISTAKQVQRQSQALKRSSHVMNKKMLSRAGTDKFLDYNFISVYNYTQYVCI